MGSKEGLASMATAMTAPGDVVLAPNPSYPIHTFGFIIAGATIRSVPTTPDERYWHSLERAMAFTVPRPSVLIVNYPSNPTAEVVDLAFYQKLVDWAKENKVWILSDLAYSELYYDGKTIMAYSPKEDLVAYGEASGPIASALELLYRESGTYYPFVDLIVADPHAAMTDGLKLAFVVGRSTVVGGTPTDMVAFSNGEVFVQMWIGVDDKLPRRVRAMYAKDRLQLRHQLDIEGWQLDVAHAPEKFTSAKAAKAKRIPFAAPAFVATKGGKVPPSKAPLPAKPAPAKAQ